MKRAIKYSLMLIIGLGTLQNCWANTKCNSLILILDPREKEKTDGKHLAMAGSFLCALQEKSVPIIISSNVVNNFCFWKNEFKQMLDDIKKEALSTKNFDDAIEKAKTLLDATEQSNKPEPSLAAELSVTNLTDDDWYCYAHKQANFILLIPKTYVTKRTQKSSGDSNAHIKECGFNITNLDKINNVSPETLLKYIQTKRSEKHINITEALQSMLITKKSISQPDSGSWNIYITGHGDPAIQKNGILAPETAYVAGIPFNDFAQLMKLFNNDITTSFVYYATCFAGGYNQTTVNEILSKLNVNFIVTAEGINEAFTLGNSLKYKINDKGTNFILSHLIFTPFFGMLENFFCNPMEFVTTKTQQDALKKDPIGAIVRNLIDPNTIQTNQPFVRIPSVGVFNALSVDTSVKILTNTIAKAHEHEGRTIDLSNPDIRTIIMYPTHIKVPLQLNGLTDIVSPATIVKDNQATHTFEKIIDSSGFNWTIYNFVRLNSSYTKITFIIKKLETLNPENSGLDAGDYEKISLDNMTIQITGKLSPDPEKLVIDSTVNVTFNFKGKPYTVSEHLENLADNQDLFDIFDTLQVSSSIGTSTPVITKKTNKDTLVKKPGALKKTLLLQQLSALELATNPEQLKKEEAWRQQNKETAHISRESILNRYRNDVYTLERQLNLLPKDQITTQERDAINTRIANIKRRTI